MFAVSANDILKLLDELESRIADDLESQRLDFKEWKSQSRVDAVDQVIEMAVCMANGGGGTVVFGVRDRTIGRADAIKGVPHDVDTNLLMKAVYDRTDPKITPVFEAITVPEGTGRLIIMHILPGMPPYTDTSGRGKIRVGKDCQLWELFAKSASPTPGSCLPEESTQFAIMSLRICGHIFACAAIPNAMTASTPLNHCRWHSDESQIA